MRSEQIVALAFVEDDLQEAEAYAEKCQADVVDVQATLIFLAGEMGRIGDEHGSENDGEQADGNIDEENPAPSVIVGDPSAEGGTDDWRDDHAHTVNGHGHALFCARETFDQDGLRDGLQSAAARSL